jgi:hypothetical protein
MGEQLYVIKKSPGFEVRAPIFSHFPPAVPIKGEGQPLVLPHKAPSSKQVIHDVPMDGFGSLLIYPRIVL